MNSLGSLGMLRFPGWKGFSGWSRNKYIVRG